METKNIKPLGRKSYGSIGHLPNSRLGPSDSSVNEGQARICTERRRDSKDVIIVQEKVDGSNVGVAKINGAIVPLTRAGYHASTSPYEQHHLFAQWVDENKERFRSVLSEGERVCGEWIAQAHGTRYIIDDKTHPFIAFDIMKDDKRITFEEFAYRVHLVLQTPAVLMVGPPLSVECALALHEIRGIKRADGEQTEGVVYRVEREGKVDFLAKYVRPDKVDGKYLESVSGQPAVWNWRPQ